MRRRAPVSGLIDRRDGNVTMLMAGGLAMLLGSAVLGVDTASLFLEKRRLQGVADAAALAAAAQVEDGTNRAQAAVATAPANQTRLTAMTIGRFDPNPAIAPGARFTAGALPSNAARVSLESRMQPIFAQVFGRQATPIAARATAARIDLAAFSIGSRLAAVRGGLPNALLSQLAGTELHLTVMDYTALAGAQVDLLRMSELLRSDIGLQAVTFGEVLGTRIALPKLVTAMAGATANAAAAQALRTLAGRLPNRNVRLDTIIDLGPLAGAVRSDPTRPVASDAFTLLRESLLISGGTRQVQTSVDLGIPGIGEIRMWLEIGEHAANSPWLSIGASGERVVRTAQTRLWLDVALVNVPLGLAAVRTPIYVELAEAEAKLASVGCNGGRARASAALDVTPAVGRVAIADLDPAALGNFQRAMELRPARVVALPLASVSAFADIRLGGTQAQRVTFNAGEIDGGTVKTVATNDVARGVASSLIRNVDLDARVLGLGLSVGPLVSSVGNVLALAAPALDMVVDQVTGLAGVRIGEADVRVNGVRCGTPMLVG
ncbi:hypothetical protein ASE78_06420 [Sphingomonas sp. Leaf25]|nr:hypothetical protein ASE78_06420 [Sphingomonas sp. Leaf25]